MNKAKVPGTIWLTGLSGAGKTTLAQGLSRYLETLAIHHDILDGDILRQSLSKDLGFGLDDRVEHLARVQRRAQHLQDAHILHCVACITPLERSRQSNRKHLEHYLEVYVQCALQTCIERDPKQLYARALRGELDDFTGISSPFEEPTQPDLIIDTTETSPEDAVLALIHLLEAKGWIDAAPPLSQT